MKSNQTRCILAFLGAIGLSGSACAAEDSVLSYKVPLFGREAVGDSTVSPSALSFPDRQVGQASPSQSVTVTNNGSRNVNFSGVSIVHGAAHFAQSNNCAYLVPSASCTINVQFTPAAEGSHSGSVVILQDSRTPEFTVELSGQGRAQSASLSAPSFPATPVGATKTVTAVLSNTGIGPLSVQSPLVTGPAFALAGGSCGGTLAVGANCDFEVAFTPTSRVPATGSLTVATGAGEKLVSLGATGLRGIATLTPGDLNFAVQQVNTTSAPKYVTLTNTGTASMSVAGVGMVAGSSEFNQTNTCGSALAVGESCVISVAFTPSLAGARAGSVGFTSDAEGATAFSVEGTGTLAATVATASFAQNYVTAGQPATFTWATGNSVSASVSCSGTTTGTASGLSGTLVATTNGTGSGTCTVIATNDAGVSVTNSAQVNVVAPPSVTSASFSPTPIRLGTQNSSTFSWATSDSTSASVTCAVPGIVNASGLTGAVPVAVTNSGEVACTVTALNAAGKAASVTQYLTVLPAYTYGWATSSYATPAACGSVTATRTAWCQRSDGTTASDGLCTATKPSTTTTTSDYSACEYSFSYGSWSTPGGCGSVTATRSASCVRSDGTTAPISYCGTPVTTVGATSYNLCTYSYSYGSWGSCSESCGGGTQTRTATCYRSDDLLVANSACGTALTSQACNTQACYSYSWSYGAWPRLNACGSVTQTRTATCMRSDGVVAASGCSGTPTTSRTLDDYSACSYSANLGGWSGCSASCGGGTQSRSVFCTRSDGTRVANIYCGSPATSQSCNTQTCG